MTQPRFRLDLVSVPSTVPPITRLRRLLKAILRGYGFRVVDAVELTPEPTPAEPGAANHDERDDGAPIRHDDVG